MKNGILAVIFALLVLAGCGAQAANGKPAAKKAAKRVVATTVASTEIMAELDVPLIGIPTSSKKLPSRYQKVKQTGSPMSPDMELIRSLKPDLVVSTSTLEADLKSGFQQADLQADFLDFRSVARMQKEITKLGKRLDRAKAAEHLNQTLTAKIKKVQAEKPADKQPRVLILMGIPGSYLVATEKSYIGDLVRLAGGKNVITGDQPEYIASNTEYLHRIDPDIILRAAHGMPDEVVKMFDKDFKTNDIWKHFKAVQTGKVYDLNEALFGMTASLNAPEALAKVKQLLYEK